MFRMCRAISLAGLCLLLAGESLSQSLTFGPAEQLVADGYHPTVSPDGDWIAYKDASGSIMKYQIGGGPLLFLNPSGSEPDWSWVNDLIVYRQGVVLYTLDPETSISTQLSSALVDDDPCWSPLGDEVAVQEDGIMTISYPGGNPGYVSCVDPDASGCEGEGPTWSPDGAWIAFEDGLEILKIQRAGGTAEVVVEGLRDVTEASWSPNGMWIAFTMEDPTYQYAHIWVVDAGGTAFGYWQATSGNYFDRRSTWSPDSRYIYFERVVVEEFDQTPLGIWRIEVFYSGCCGIYTGGITGNANCSEDGKLTLSDISRLIDRVYISKELLCCEASGNTNGSVDCKITLSDITRLIDAVYISKADPEDCMVECE